MDRKSHCSVTTAKNADHAVKQWTNPHFVRKCKPLEGLCLGRSVRQIFEHVEQYVKRAGCITLSCEKQMREERKDLKSILSTKGKPVSYHIINNKTYIWKRMLIFQSNSHLIMQLSLVWMILKNKPLSFRDHWKLLPVTNLKQTSLGGKAVSVKDQNYKSLPHDKVFTDATLMV